LFDFFLANVEKKNNFGVETVIEPAEMKEDSETDSL
jgi:hypothetical protein